MFQCKGKQNVKRLRICDLLTTGHFICIILWLLSYQFAQLQEFDNLFTIVCQPFQKNQRKLKPHGSESGLKLEFCNEVCESWKVFWYVPKERFKRSIGKAHLLITFCVFGLNLIFKYYFDTLPHFKVISVKQSLKLILYST